MTRRSFIARCICKHMFISIFSYNVIVIRVALLCVGFSHECRDIAVPLHIVDTERQWLRVTCANLPKSTLINHGSLVWIWKVLWHSNVYKSFPSLCIFLSLYVSSIHLNTKILILTWRCFLLFFFFANWFSMQPVNDFGMIRYEVYTQ